MARIPYDVKRGVYHILLRNGDMKFDEFYAKTFFISGTQKKRRVMSAIKNIEGVGIEDGTVKLYPKKCPLWLQYMLYVKEKKSSSNKEISYTFNKVSDRIYNEMHRYSEYLNITKVGNEIYYEYTGGR